MLAVVCFDFCGSPWRRALQVGVGKVWRTLHLLSPVRWFLHSANVCVLLRSRKGEQLPAAPQVYPSQTVFLPELC